MKRSFAVLILLLGLLGLAFAARYFVGGALRSRGSSSASPSPAASILVKPPESAPYVKPPSLPPPRHI